MNYQVYERLLQQYLAEAYKNSDGTTRGMAEYLETIQKPGRISMNREEKIKAIDTARKAFEEHRHWPVEIVFSQLGVDLKAIKENL